MRLHHCRRGSDGRRLRPLALGNRGRFQARQASVARRIGKPLGALRHGRHEAVAVAVQRLDVTLVPPGVADSAPHGGQGALQGGVADRLPLPDLRAQLLLGDDALALGE
jgi:hypothetical protein